MHTTHSNARFSNTSSRSFLLPVLFCALAFAASFYWLYPQAPLPQRPHTPPVVKTVFCSPARNTTYCFKTVDDTVIRCPIAQEDTGNTHPFTDADCTLESSKILHNHYHRFYTDLLRKWKEHYIKHLIMFNVEHVSAFSHYNNLKHRLLPPTGPEINQYVKEWHGFLHGAAPPDTFTISDCAAMWHGLKHAGNDLATFNTDNCTTIWRRAVYGETFREFEINDCVTREHTLPFKLDINACVMDWYNSIHGEERAEYISPVPNTPEDLTLDDTCKRMFLRSGVFESLDLRLLANMDDYCRFLTTHITTLPPQNYTEKIFVDVSFNPLAHGLDWYQYHTPCSIIH